MIRHELTGSDIVCMYIHVSIRFMNVIRMVSTATCCYVRVCLTDESGLFSTGQVPNSILCCIAPVLGLGSTNKGPICCCVGAICVVHAVMWDQKSAYAFGCEMAMAVKWLCPSAERSACSLHII